MPDRIAYVVTALPGGVDGRDPYDKGGPKFATFNKSEAEKKKTPWDTIVPTIVTSDDSTRIVREARKKLTAIEFLLLSESIKG